MENVNESINDKNLFKAVFLAGGPGSGKSYIANNMFLSKSGISPFGVKVINSDTFFELGLEKAGLSKIINVDEKDIYDQQMVIRADAKAKTAIKQGFYIDGMLPIIIDGTGKDFKKISEQAKDLYNIGYDVYMVFINTSLSVALERNNQRERKVDPTLVNKMWLQVQSNIGSFQRFFGNKNFVVIDNNDYFEPVSSESEAFLYSLFKIGKNLIESPLENLNGIKIINTLRNIKGKYLSDIMEADISKMDKQYQRYARMIREKIEVKKEGNMKDSVVEIKEDVVIKQKEGDIILEEGDRIKVLKENDHQYITMSWRDFYKSQHMEYLRGLTATVWITTQVSHHMIWKVDFSKCIQGGRKMEIPVGNTKLYLEMDTPNLETVVTLSSSGSAVIGIEVTHFIGREVSFRVSFDFS